MQKNTRSILACSERIVVPSEFFRRIVCKKYNIDSNKVFVCCSGGINTDVFFPASSDSKKAHAFTLGFASRILPGKGWEVLLKACAALPDRDFRLILVGDGPDRTNMLALIRELKLESNIQLHGLLPQEELGNIYRQLDVFVFPTELAESLGLVAIEAMACGTPVIASDFAAPADYIIDGVNGYKFPKADAQALCQRLLLVRSLSEEDSIKLKTGALETARKYTRSAVTQALKTILTE